MATNDAQKLKRVFDSAVKAGRFSEPSLHAQLQNLRSLPKASKLVVKLGAILTPAEVETVQRRLVRASFLIEPVNEDVTSTKYDVRWSNRLASDPRAASFDVCLAIHESLCGAAAEAVADALFCEELKLVLAWDLSPHEFPVDYESKTASPIHTVANLQILRDTDYLRLLKIRRSLLDPKLNPDRKLFQNLFGKVLVKSYLTDRAQTGDFKTNREKRWEAHPQSPQFALRRDCFSVELELIDQLFRFQHFPTGVVRYLQGTGVPIDTGKVARCPVTLDPLDFEVLAQEVADPVHGKAAYQVGHLNPLKAGAGAEFRHHKKNISWITADGNRIQGHLTLKETRKLLLRISANYEALLKTGEISPP
jgi:hypothetical protein